MTKKDFLANCWVHYSKRLPANCGVRWIIVWNYRLKAPVAMISHVAYTHYKKRIENPDWPENKQNSSNAYAHEYWMELEEPRKKAG